MPFTFNGETPETIKYNNANVAKLVYNNTPVWYQKVQYTQTSSSFPITLQKTMQLPASNYNISGLTTRTGTPEKENPATISHVGDLVTDTASEYYGKYKIDILATDTNNNTLTTSIYLSAPLRGVTDNYDYIDFDSGKLVRKIREITFTGNESWSRTAGSGGRPAYFRVQQSTLNKVSSSQSASNQLCNYFNYGAPTTTNTILGISCYISGGTTTYIRFRDDTLTTTDLVKEFMKEKYENGNPCRFVYLLATPQESSIELPDILLADRTTIIGFGTNLTPPSATFTYYGTKF